MTTVAFATAACGGEGPATFQPIPAGNLSSTFHRPAESATGEDDASAKAQREGKARLNQQLIKAAWDNDLRRARDLIAKGAEINAKDNTVQSSSLAMGPSATSRS